MAALLACGVAAYVVGDQPRVPDDICVRTTGGPRYSELLGDGRITVAAVFGSLAGGAADRNAWSARKLADELRTRGYVETSPDHFERGHIAIDIALYPDDEEILGRALTDAFATHELVYYNGHSYDGDLVFTVPDSYRIAVLDSCWTTQHYSARLIGPDRDVIANSERSVTGSIASFVLLLDGLFDRSVTWQPLLERMNRHAVTRARARAPFSRFKGAEHYRLDSVCHGKSAGQRTAS